MSAPYMEFSFQFISPIELMIEETEQGVALISGTLLVEGESKNHNLYTIDEMEHIAKETEGKPLYFGTKAGINPNTGKWTQQLHANDEPNRVGRIIQTIFDTVNRKIRFIAEVVNTPEFPDITSKIKAGWGVSIGGRVMKAKYVLNKLKELCVKIENMVVEHVSLIPPEIVRGQDEAKVENVAIQECMIFEKPVKKVIFIIEGKGVKIKDAFLE